MCSPNWQLFRGATNFTPHCQDGGDGWWKRDPNSCVMLSGTAFGPNCATRVSAILSGIGDCGAAGAGAGGPSSYATAEARQLKTLVLELSVEAGAFALQDARIIYNFPPRTFLRDAEYLLEIKGRTGETLFDMTLRDPQVQTIFSAEGGQPTKRMADTARFTAYVPFVQDMTRAVMTDRASNETVLEVELEPVVAAFCALHQDDRACAPN